jgi:hypothetical protein
MTTKLESLSAFKSKSINKMQMKNILGGVETAGGTRDVTDNCGTVILHVSYSSDHNMGTGPNGRPLMDYCDEVATPA